MSLLQQCFPLGWSPGLEPCGMLWPQLVRSSRIPTSSSPYPQRFCDGDPISLLTSHPPKNISGCVEVTAVGFAVLTAELPVMEVARLAPGPWRLLMDRRGSGTSPDVSPWYTQHKNYRNLWRYIQLLTKSRRGIANGRRGKPNFSHKCFFMFLHAPQSPPTI